MTVRLYEKLRVEPGIAADEAVTKSQLDTAAADARNRSNHTGTQPSTSISDFETAVQNLISQVIDGAPGALDTLNELAAALGDDPNFAATIASSIDAINGRLDSLETNPGGRSAAALLGDGAASTYTITHGWDLPNKNRVQVELVEEVSGDTVLAQVSRPNVNAVTVSFGTFVPATDQFRVLLKEIVG